MNPHFKVGILLAVAAADVVLLTCLSSRRGRISRSRHGRFFLWAASALYFPLISCILSYLTNDLSSSLAKQSCIQTEGRTESGMIMQEHDCLEELVGMFMLTVLVQSLKSKADLAALAVAAVASPAAGADDIDSQKIRPSMDSLVYSFWVAGLVINTMRLYGHTEAYVDLLFQSVLVLFLFWVLGAGRMVLTFAAFRHANGSFALGCNAQLIEGYMSQLQEVSMEEAAVPRLIVTGERNEDVEESLQGYRVKPSALQSSRLVTLDKVWSSDDHRLHPQLKDLCLSFCLFKCLRRRFADYKLAEAGSTWAFRFVSNGLLGENEEHNHERMFQVIAHELSFASDFYYSPLPLASLGAWPAALHFILSSLICAPLFIILLLPIPHVLFEIFVPVDKSPWMDYGDVASCIVLMQRPGESPLLKKNGDGASFFPTHYNYLIFPIALILLAAVDASIEICAMVTSVRSEWTKISMVAHCINKSRGSWMISTCLLRCKSPRHWKDEIAQSLLLMPIPPQHHHRLFNFKQTFLSRKNKHVNVSSDVKAAVIRSLRLGGRQLSNGIATVQRRCPHLSWACHGCVTTSTDAILVWHIATCLFEIKYPSSDSTNMAVASSLSRYCMYLVAEAPDLLPDNAVRTKVRCRQVKECVETSMRGAASGSDLYSQLVAFEPVSDESSSEAGKVVKQGLKLGKQLVEEVEWPSEEDQAENQQESAKHKEAMWELLAEFWSEMILYLAPSDNVKGHIEVLQRGGELITLLWALLLHAGITTRPAPEAPAP